MYDVSVVLGKVEGRGGERGWGGWIGGIIYL